MPRLFPLLVAAFLLLGLPSQWAGPAFADVQAAAEADDCCPDPDPHDGFECCDVDMGLCCAASVMALPSLPDTLASAPAKAAQHRVLLAPPLLVPRATGPPPTPPPIG